MTTDPRTIFLSVGPGRPVDCPLAPPETATVQSRALHRACLIVGGVDRLATALGRPREDVERWIRGEAPTPEDVFQRAVEILLLYAAKPGQP
jgi:hypothetical protein